MGKPVLVVAFLVILLGAEATAQEGAGTGPQGVVPLTPELAKEIRKDRYVDESVQTTNGNIIGIFMDVLSDGSGKPVVGVVQAYDNVTNKKQFMGIPWGMFRFDRQSRLIQVETAADQLRTAPKYKVEEIAGLAKDPELQRIYGHFGMTVGGGSVAATMGTQSGQGSSTLARPPTNEAQPRRGSVAAMYALGALTVLALAFGYFVRRRT